MNDEKPNKSAKLRTVEQISAGGVPFRQNDSDFEVAIISAKPSLRWQLPKGIIDRGETPEDAALREVREEAGIETELLSKIVRVYESARARRDCRRHTNTRLFQF